MIPREAKFYHKLPNKAVGCDLCEHYCVIENHEPGFCRVRENRNGILRTLVYGLPILHKPEPIEAHYLYHFQPGRKTYAVGTPGCNFRCWWCKTWKASRIPLPKNLASVETIEPSQIIGMAKINGTQSIAFTYTEPTIFFEYAYDIARLSRRAGLSNILVTNGYMSPEMLDAFLPYIDAACLDLKTFRKKTYSADKKILLSTVLDNMKKMKAAGVWKEVNILLVAGVNDSREELSEIASFIADELGRDTPWHINWLFPWDPARLTPEGLDNLRMAKEIGQAAGLHHIYLERRAGEYHTHCRTCGKVLIERSGTQVSTHYNQDGTCPQCYTALAGIFGTKASRRAIVEYQKKPLVK
jgi:pyruvate formate lyase activating enzyme